MTKYLSAYNTLTRRSIHLSKYEFDTILNVRHLEKRSYHRRLSGPISPLPDFIRISREISSDKPNEMAIGFIPIRLGKRHAAIFTNSWNHRPYYWEYIKDDKRSFTPYKWTAGGRNILLVPFNRGKRDPTLRNLSSDSLHNSRASGEDRHRYHYCRPNLLDKRS